MILTIENKKMSDLQSKIDRLNGAVTKKIDFWKAHLTRKTTKLQEKEIEIDELHEKVDEKEMLIDELIEEMEEKEIEICDLQEKADGKENEIKKLQGKADEKGLEIEKLKSQLLLANTQLEERESKLTETEEIIEKYVREKKVFLQFVKKVHTKHC